MKTCPPSRVYALGAVLLVLLAISTGARRSELINLKWADVDLKAARATVYETKNGDLEIAADHVPVFGTAGQYVRYICLPLWPLLFIAV